MSERPLPPLCAAIHDDLSAWIDGELDEPRAREVGRHVTGCASCRRRLDALHAVDGSLRAFADAPLAPVEAARLDRVRARLAAQRRDEEERARDAPRATAALAVASASASRTGASPPRRRRRVTAGLAAAAAVAFGLLVVPVLFERPALRVPGPSDDTVPRAVADGAADELAAGEAVPLDTPDAFPIERRPRLLTPGPLGASAPAEPDADAALAPPDVDPADLPVVERLDALEALPRIPELPSAERRRLAALLDPTGAAAGEDPERLRDSLARWRAMPAPERETLRQRWQRVQALSPEERHRLLAGDTPPP